MGVKFELESRELMTCALVKVAQLGHIVIALCVLETMVRKHLNYWCDFDT